MAGSGFKHYDTVIRLPEYQSTLYTKTGSRRKVFQCRMKPQNGPAIIKSTKTTSLAQATEFAKQWFEATRTAENAGLSPKMDPSFVSVWQHFRRANASGQRISAGRLKTLTGIVEKYPCAYFGTMNIRHIHSPQYEQYKEWRLNYWITGPGSQELLENPEKRHKKVPAPSTLRYEHSAFVQILRWSRKVGYLARVPVLDGFKTVKGIAKTRGGGPSPAQWARITRELWDRAFAPVDSYGKRKQLAPTHKHERANLYYLVVFMGGSMIRPSEALRLKWKHIAWKDSSEKEGNRDLLVHVPASISKTKEERIAVGTNRCAEYMHDWKKLTLHSDQESYVFPRYGGQRLENANRSFKKVLKTVNAEEDHEGLRITLYSCRHFAITSALKRGRPILDVAHFAGTSVHNIEKRYWRVDLVKTASKHALQSYFSPEEIRGRE